MAGAIFGNVMLFSAAVYFGESWEMTAAMSFFFQASSGLLAIFSLCYSARSFFKNAWRGLTQRTLHIDLPICFALLLAFAVSVASLANVSGFQGVYFDSVTGLIFLLLTARGIQEALLAQGKRLSEFADTLLPPNSSSLQQGDEFWVAHGETAAADGTVLRGESSFQEAVLTGEPFPVAKERGSKIYAGTTNLGNPLLVKATEVGNYTAVGKLQELVKKAQNEPSQFEQLAQKIVPWFVLATILIAFVVGLYWWFHAPLRVLDVVTSTLIVSCPCAIALAVPLSRVLALRRFWKQGIVLKSAESLERLAQIHAVVLDKTGTLSEAALCVKKMSVHGNVQPDFWHDAYYMCSATSHPVARAVRAEVAKHLRDETTESTTCPLPLRGSSSGNVMNEGVLGVMQEGMQEFMHEGAKPEPTVDEFSAQEIPGKGVLYKNLIFGSIELVKQNFPQWELHAVACENEGAGRFVFLVGTEVFLSFALGEVWRDEAPELLKSLSQQNLELHVATGDAAFTTSQLQVLTLAKVTLHSGCQPQDKLALVQSLQNEGKKVFFVGDGVNDAAALVRADVGLAMGHGADLAILSAAGFISEGNIGKIARIFRVAKYENQTLRLVIGVSVLYNIVAIVIAVQGFLHPLMAALIMPLSGTSTLFLSSWRTGKKLWKFSTT